MCGAVATVVHAATSRRNRRLKKRILSELTEPHGVSVIKEKAHAGRPLIKSLLAQGHLLQGNEVGICVAALERAINNMAAANVRQFRRPALLQKGQKYSGETALRLAVQWIARKKLLDRWDGRDEAVTLDDPFRATARQSFRV